LNVSIGALLLWFTVTQLRKTSVPPRYIATELIFPSKLPPLYKMPRLKLPPPHPVAELPRKIEAQPPKPEPAKPEIVHLQTPAMPTMPGMPATIVVAPAQPKVGSFASAKNAIIATHDRAPAIKTGGFGDPSGVVQNPNAARPATIAAIGKFENAPGTGQGAASPHTSSVATGGFGSGVGTAPEVLSEPRPQYTQEARQLRIQGEITLQVRFSVDGKVEVLRVVSGLGHGLDQEAALVAEQIRFKPAVKDGQPTDHVTYIHILFQLA
jgi:TonB family protein